jgi:hypothetical protein
MKKLKNEIKENALLAKIPFKESVPDVRAVFGYVKYSEKGDAIHLYNDLDLFVYMEIRVEDVVAQKATENAEEPTILYLSNNAKVREVINPSNYQLIGDFLAQPTIEDFLQELEEEDDEEGFNEESRRRRPKMPRRTRRLLRRFKKGRCFKWHW